MIRSKLSFYWLCLILLLAACGPVQAPVDVVPSATAPSRTAAPSSTPSPSLAPSPVPRTPTPDPRAGATQTQAAWTATFQAFTQEAAASQTPAAQTEAASQAQAALTGTVNEATLSAGYKLTEAAILGALQTTVTPKVIGSFHAPDGKKLAEVIQYPCTQVQKDPETWPDALEIIRIGDREVAKQHYFCGGMGAYGLEGKFWTPDSRFFYYTDAREGWPDGGYPWMRPISRYDTVTGKSETLSYAVFSPDRRMIAGDDGVDLVVWEVNGDTVRRFSGLPDNHPAYAMIWAAWSPDGRGLAYLTNSFCQDASPCPSALNRVDTRTWKQTRLADLSGNPMLTVEWKTANTLELWGADFTSMWVYDLKKNTLAQVTPTVTPTP